MNRGMMSSDKHDWRTPPRVFERMNARWRFTIDAAASPENSLCRRFWTKEDDAIAQDWTGHVVWCNPPYGREQKAFVRKAAERKAFVSVLLIPARPDTIVWQECILGQLGVTVEFVRGRITFVGAPAPAPFPSAIVTFVKPPHPFKARGVTL